MEARFKYYEDLAESLDEKEKRAHEETHGGARRIIEGKRFLLLQQMCKDAGLRDRHLARDGVEGSQLVGMAERTG